LLVISLVKVSKMQKNDEFLKHMLLNQ